MSKVLKEQIKSIEKIADTIFKMTIKSEYISKNAKPGQFVNIKCCQGNSALLRRPISICNVDKEAATFDIVLQVKGTGTHLLSDMVAGNEVDLIGPLGTPFYMPDHSEKIAVVGGGIGTFPLLYLLDTCRNSTKTTFLGFRNTNYMVLIDEFKNASDRIFISTDDGSFGYKGLIIDLLIEDLIKNKYDIIYTCGPLPMIKKVVSVAKQHDIKCQVSLEERMGCGIGACLVCACKTKLGDEWQYSHVCKDGPVFWSEEVLFDD